MLRTFWDRIQAGIHFAVDYRMIMASGANALLTWVPNHGGHLYLIFTKFPFFRGVGRGRHVQQEVGIEADTFYIKVQSLTYRSPKLPPPPYNTYRNTNKIHKGLYYVL
jgi:hypothetical protein